MNKNLYYSLTKDYFLNSINIKKKLKRRLNIKSSLAYSS